MRDAARLWLLVFLPAFGCGKGDAPVAKDAKDGAAAVDAVVTTGGAEDVAPRVDAVDAANQTADAGPMTAPEVGDSAGTVAVEDAAPSPLPPRLADRIQSMKPGCVGLGADGRTILYIDEGIRELGSGRETWLYYIHTDRAAEAQKWEEWPLTEAVDPEILEGMRKTLAGRDLVPCETVTGSRLALPSAPPVRVVKRGATFEIDVKGQPKRTLPATDEGMGDLEVVEGYWAVGVGSVFVRLAPSDQPEYLNERVIRIDPAVPEVERLW